MLLPRVTPVSRQQLPVCPSSLLARVILLPPALYCPEQPFSLSFTPLLYDIAVQILIIQYTSFANTKHQSLCRVLKLGKE